MRISVDYILKMQCHFAESDKSSIRERLRAVGALASRSLPVGAQEPATSVGSNPFWAEGRRAPPPAALHLWSFGAEMRYHPPPRSIGPPRRAPLHPAERTRWTATLLHTLDAPPFTEEIVSSMTWMQSNITTARLAPLRFALCSDDKRGRYRDAKCSDKKCDTLPSWAHLLLKAYWPDMKYICITFIRYLGLKCVELSQGIILFFLSSTKINVRFFNFRRIDTRHQAYQHPSGMTAKHWSWGVRR